ncbi:hypothetical protein ATANTOWER_012333 [Ataeniobius toweri]|uniref:Uncharacterized protein n=1 Tax=Ataeniobius toweri TaxID=208326 RepID=A0ABU7B6D3_9TELE|nr:hypothetical protein [Ataeniobius toweri]
MLVYRTWTLEDIKKAVEGFPHPKGDPEGFITGMNMLRGSYHLNGVEMKPYPWWFVCRLHAGCLCCVFSVQGVTGRCCCTGLAHLRAISWVSYGVETQREASARFFSLGVVNLLLKEAMESFWSPVSLMSCSEEFGNSSLDAPALSLHSDSNFKPSFSGAAST